MPACPTLALDASALALDPVWLALDPEGRGILFSLWLTCQVHGTIPVDPVAAARLAALDSEPVLFWWDTLRHWFVAHASDPDRLMAPILLKGTMAALARKEHARKAALARHSRLGPDPVASAEARLSALVPLVERLERKAQRPSKKAKSDSCSGMCSGRPISGLGDARACARADARAETLDSAPLLEEIPGGETVLGVDDLRAPAPKSENEAQTHPVSGSLPLEPPPSLEVSKYSSFPQGTNIQEVLTARPPAPARISAPDPEPAAPVAPAKLPRGFRALFAGKAEAERWFDEALALREQHVQKMPARLRELQGVAAHRPKPSAEAFLARVADGYPPRLLCACLWCYLQADENVQRGYLQGLEVFWGNPRARGSKATFEGYVTRAQAELARADAKRAAQGAAPAPVPPPVAALPGLEDALAAAGVRLPPVVAAP